MARSQKDSTERESQRVQIEESPFARDGRTRLRALSRLEELFDLFPVGLHLFERHLELSSPKFLVETARVGPRPNRTHPVAHVFRASALEDNLYQALANLLRVPALQRVDDAQLIAARPLEAIRGEAVGQLVAVLDGLGGAYLLDDMDAQ